MFDFLKTASGGLNLGLVATILGWSVATFGMVVSIYKHRSEVFSAQESARASKDEKEKEEKLRKKAESRLAKAEKGLTVANEEIKRLQPKPFPERLMAVLKQIDPKITDALAHGVSDFKSNMNPSDLRALQELAKEAEAANWLMVSPSIRTLIGGGSEGSLHYVEFSVSPKILENQRSEQGAAHDRE